MIYVCSKKFFVKRDKKIAKSNPFFIIDGENYATTGAIGGAASYGKKDAAPIASLYSNCHTVGGFCPDSRLYTMLKKIKKGEKINDYKYQDELMRFLESKSLIAAINVAFKALVALGPDNPQNIFVVIPGVEYKIIGQQLIERMRSLLKSKENAGFDCIFPQEVLKQDISLLKTLPTSTQLEYVDKRSKKLEEKYKLAFIRDDD